MCFIRGSQLVSASEDGSVRLWDLRDKQITNKILPHLNEKLCRPHLGKWVGAAALSDYWLVSLDSCILSLFLINSFFSCAVAVLN